MLRMNGSDKIENLEKKINSLKVLLEEDNLELNDDASWEALVKHVEVHKYLINQDISWTISWSDAVFSWMENVYTPLKRVIDWWEVKSAFSEYTKGQLLFAVSSHWYYMNEKNPEVTPEVAASDFAAQFGKGVGKWVSRFKFTKTA